jgi:hypothetical protein
VPGARGRGAVAGSVGRLHPAEPEHERSTNAASAAKAEVRHERATAAGRADLAEAAEYDAHRHAGSELTAGRAACASATSGCASF